jgi:alpha-glucosidase
MKKCFALLFFCCLLKVSSAADSLLLRSPDGRILVYLHTSKAFYFELSIDGRRQPVRTTIDLLPEDAENFAAALKRYKVSRTKVNTQIASPGGEKAKQLNDNYNQLRLTSFNTSLECRLYNNGLAWRWLSMRKDSINIRNEIVQFDAVGQAILTAPVVQHRTDADRFHTSFEELYTSKPLDSFPEHSLLFSPLLLQMPDCKLAITESDVLDYPGMFLETARSSHINAVFAPIPIEEKLTDALYAERIVTKRSPLIAHTSGTRSFPWRVMAIAREDRVLAANSLVYQLARPSMIGDASWVKPGKCTDEWIIDINLFNVPFKTGINTNTYKFYIDFAKRFGFDRIMMDAGWSEPGDLFKIRPEINMDSLSAYAKQKGIKICMWTLAATLDRQLDSALLQFRRWGIDFIMTDFIDRDDQKASQFFERIAAACAREKMMIMFHGCPPPKGFNRSYPNNITREAVLGSEYNAWSNKPSPEHDLMLPFTRMLSGPFDYEPGLLDNATQTQFQPIWGKVMSQGTRCHQLAMFVVYDNPVPIFSGNPSQGLMEPAFMEFLGSIPAGWDTTIVLDGKLGDYIITARRKGDSWYIGAMTDWTARDFSIPTDFLGGGKWEAASCTDGVNADRYPADYRLGHSVIQAGDSIPLQLAPGGGAVIVLKKQ